MRAVVLHQVVRQRQQQMVSGCVAIGVIDLFESVHVQQHDRQGSPPGCTLLHQLRQLLIQHAAIEKPCERIARCLLSQQIFECLNFCQLLARLGALLVELGGAQKSVLRKYGQEQHQGEHAQAGGPHAGVGLKRQGLHTGHSNHPQAHRHKCAGPALPTGKCNQVNAGGDKHGIANPQRKAQACRPGPEAKAIQQHVAHLRPAWVGSKATMHILQLRADKKLQHQQRPCQIRGLSGVQMKTYRQPQKRKTDGTILPIHAHGPVRMSGFEVMNRNHGLT